MSHTEVNDDPLPASGDEEDLDGSLTLPPEYKADLVVTVPSKGKGRPPLPPRPYSPTKKVASSKAPSSTNKPQPTPTQSVKSPVQPPQEEYDNTEKLSSSSPKDDSPQTETNKNLEQIMLSQQQIDLAVSEFTSTAQHSPLVISFLESVKIPLTVPCPSGKLPFTICGGAEKSLMISVDAVLHPDLLSQLRNGDIVFSVEKNELPGMTLRDANIILQTYMNASESIEIEYIPEGKVSNNIRNVLTEKGLTELHTIIRDNVYAKAVPYTTRPPKEGEVDGEHYNFVSIDTFAELQHNEMLLEQGCFQGHFYGTPRPDETVVDDLSSVIFVNENNSKVNSQQSLEILAPEPEMVQVPVIPEVVTDNLGPLPPNWEIAYSDLGEKYFIDHNRGVTQWDDPREALPEGWERIDHAEHGVFYVDHVNQKTQYERPTIESTSATSNGLKSSLANGGGDLYKNGHAFDGASSSNGNNNNNSISWNGPQSYHKQTASEKVSTPSTGTLPHTNGSTKQQPHVQLPVNHQTWQSGTRMFEFTSDPTKLQGELVTTRIQKGPKGLGFTLIGNDGTSECAEFIQIKSIIPGGPAALNNVLHPGDILVYVNNNMMLGATQEDACQVFRCIGVGEHVTLQVCRGYPLLLDPLNKIVTENVYTPQLNNHHRPREQHTIEIHKGDSGYGFTITDSLPGQRVKAILQPQQCPNLQEGDIIVEIDGVNVRSVSHEQVIQMLRDHPRGFRTTMVVSRNSTKHRSRTPTAAFRYGENRTTPVPVVQPRSKTPAPQPLRPTKSSALKQYRPSNAIQTTLKVPGEQLEIYENAVRLRPSSTTLGFASTPTYVPASAFNPDRLYNHQLITVNLIKRPDGFGFHLVGGSDSLNVLKIGDIVAGSAAFLDGRLRSDDRLIEVDGQNVENCNHADVVELIKRAGEVGHVKLVVARPKEELPRSTSLPFAYNFTPPHVLNGLACDPRLSHVVDLAKLDSEDFGCTVVTHANGHRYISRITPGSPADRCGRMIPGDCVVAINSVPIQAMSHQQVINFIKSSGNTISFTIDPTKRLAYEPSVVSGDVDYGVRATQNTPSQIYGHGHPQAFLNNNNYGTLRSNPQGRQRSLTSVELPRGKKGFGFSIRGGYEFNQMPLFVLKIADDGPAAASGKLYVGDQIVEINGENTRYMTHERAIQLIKEHPVVRLIVQREERA